MKTKYIIYIKHLLIPIFFFGLGLQSFTLFAQVTLIPDSNFEQALIDQGIDTDGIINGQVLTSDIENVTTLNVVNEVIFDLTGIEGFASLENLDVSRNLLSSLDVSNNTQLKELYCSNDSSPNMTIQSLDLSNNINLELLYADNLYLLEELNLKNGNNNILTIELSCVLDGDESCDLPLTCVTVDDEDAATNDEPPYDTWYIAADFSYSEDCTMGVGDKTSPIFSLYPNPVKDMLHIESKKAVIHNIKVYDLVGNLLLKTAGNANEINTSKLPAGIFFVKLETERGTLTRKIIKQ